MEHEKHHHGGKSSEQFFKAKDILHELNLNKNQILLDAGCGNGYLSIEASKKVKKVIAIDLHEESINSLKNYNIENIEAIKADINKLNLNNNSIDVCLLINVLHGLIQNKEDDSIKELNRVVKKSGLLCVVEFKKESSMGPSQEIKLDSKQVEEIFPGFKKVKSVEMTNHYKLILEKK